MATTIATWFLVTTGTPGTARADEPEGTPPESPTPAPPEGEPPAEPPPADPPPAETKAPAKGISVRPPPAMRDWLGVGYDGTLGGLQALTVKYWTSRVGFQALVGFRFEAFNEATSADNERAGLNFGFQGRVLIKAAHGDRAQLNLIAGAGLVFFRHADGDGGISSFDFIAEVGLQPEVFITRTFTIHGLVGVGFLLPGVDSPSGQDSFVLNFGGSANGTFGFLAGLGFTFYLAPKAKE